MDQNTKDRKIRHRKNRDRADSRMEIGWHVKGGGSRGKSGDSADGFVPVFDGIAGRERFPEPFDRRVPGPDRLYIGDEFCVNRLPGAGKLTAMLEKAGEQRLPVTFLTPVLTDISLAACTGLFECLHQWDPSAEVVVNDLGVLFYLKKTHPGFRLAMGRLFNKGFKDPRLIMDGRDKGQGRNKNRNQNQAQARDQNRDQASDQNQAQARDQNRDRLKVVVNSASFEQSGFQRLARSLGVSRFEQDLFPHADPELPGDAGFDRSVYFPFGYVTTGRACFTAGLNGNPHTRFRYGAGCPGPCNRRGVQLTHPETDQTLFQMGNTIFYRYTSPMIRGLFNRAETDGIRLVYQGGGEL